MVLLPTFTQNFHWIRIRCRHVKKYDQVLLWEAYFFSLFDTRIVAKCQPAAARARREIQLLQCRRQWAP
jgi:hypothetical protein